ncbi:MAG: hypothetical protein EBT79_07445 [Actinobacteria bacterium]|nr:hypothetical protein [Actinomycetota bacterium]NBR67093.1 hypothetical protein [Actinomycetota bacterium]
MKVTNVSSTTIYLRDLKFVAQAQTEGRRGEDRYIAPGGSVYLPNTSQVLRSAIEGDLNAWLRAGVVTLDDTELLAANGNPGDSVTLTHDFGYAPIVYVLKQVGATWVDATGTVDIVHNVVAGLAPTVFESVTVTNTTAGALTFLIRLN